MATFIIRYLRNLFDVNTTGAVPGDVLELSGDGVTWVPGAGGGGGGAPTTADYLVGTADAALSNEIVVGPTPGGELGNTWAAPTVDTVHSGSSHAATQSAAEATAAAALAAHVLVDVIDGDAAGGVLSGTYPNPGFAADMATQAELDAVSAGAVILAPASSARNVIQPTAGAVIAAIVKAHAAQSVDLMQFQDSAGNVLVEFSKEVHAYLTNWGSTEFGTADGGANNPSSINKDGWMYISSVDPTAPVIQIDVADSWGLGPQTGGVMILNGSDGVGTSLQAFIVGNAGELSITPATATAVPLTLRGIPIIIGTGSPEGVVTAPVGGLFLRSDGGGATTLYVKESGAGNTGWAAVGGSGGAPTAATYITQTPDAGLSAEQALSLLATGLVKNTTGTGVLSIGAQGTDYYAPGGTDVAVADGGTGASTAAGARTALDVPSNAEAVLDTLFDANTILAATADDTPAALTVAASTILGRKASGNIAAMTATEAKAVLAIAESDVANLTTDLAAKVPNSLFDANTVLAANTDDTPAAVTMGASTILARLAAGNIVAATPAQIRTLLGVPTYLYESVALK